MDLRGRTDQNRPVPPMPTRRTTATVLGACGIAIPALLAAGGAAARPGGAWLGVPGWAPGAAILAAAAAAGPGGRIEEDRSRRAPASCSPSGSSWRGRRWRACGLSPGRPCSRWRWRASRS